MRETNNHSTILEFGSANLHLAIYDKFILNQNSFYKGKLNYTTINNSIDEKSVINLITKVENDIDQHLNEITLLTDSPSIYSLDFSIQKNFDKKKITNLEIDYLINEAKNVINLNNIDKEILHILRHQIIIDDKIIEDKSNILEDANKVTIELKFILINKSLCELYKKLFLKKHIKIKNILCTSYIKSLQIINKNDLKGLNAFVDIGLKKSSLSIFEDNKLLYLNNTFVSGEYITKDICKILNLDYRKAESKKFKFSKNNKIKEEKKYNKDNELLKKIINSRLEEIIELLFFNCPISKKFNNQTNLKLYFIGNGSKVLNENLLSFGPEFNFISEMSIMADEIKECCDGAMKYLVKENESYVKKSIINIENTGFFEMLFNYFSRK